MSRPSVLYIVYWGAAEPLGRALVLPAVEQLARAGITMTLVTFEKSADLVAPSMRENIEQRLGAAGVRWVPLRYHKRPLIPAKLYDVTAGVLAAVVARLGGRFDIVHARTFVGGLIGLIAAPRLGARLIFHNEGFYPDEQVDGGVWTRESLPHRLARNLEARMYAQASGIVALSRRARCAIEALPDVRRRMTPVIAVPSTVDLQRFALPPMPGRTRRDGLRLVYSGSVGRRYLIDRIAAFTEVALREHGNVHLRVLGREPEVVASALDRAGVPRTAWSIDSIPHEAMRNELVAHDAGLFFLTQGLSEHGCSPTKIGEYWACGLPVVTTPNVSDTDEIIERNRVGVIVREHSAAGYRKAVKELDDLLADPALPARCRRAAEEHYGLVPACERQLELYRAVVDSGRW